MRSHDGTHEGTKDFLDVARTNGKTPTDKGYQEIDTRPIYFLDRPSDPWECMGMQTTTYEIPAENLARLADRLDTLIKKAIKLGCEPPTYTIGASYEKEVTRRSEVNEFRFDGEEALEFPTIQEFVTYRTVTVSGSAPKIEGWRFAATCDYAELPVIIRTLLTDVAIPERYRSCGAICEHCKLDRGRKECCILVHEDGRMIQVGKSCLKDFLGHKSPERLAEMAELLRDLDDDCRAYGASNVLPDPGLTTVLMWTSSVISKLGWCPKSKEDLDDPNGRVATATIVNRYMGEYARCMAKRETFKHPLPTRGDFDRAVAAVEYAKALPGNSDYEENVKAVAARLGVSSRNFGIAVSIMGSYDREMAKRAERDARKPSEFVGTVSRRVGCACVKKTCKCPAIKVFVTRVISLPDYGYGVSYINIMRDPSGNALTWKTGTCLSTGSEYTLTGTVKEHDDSKYGKQTVLTRCKVEMIEHDADGSIAA
jgi:hypothetical protein